VILGSGYFVAMGQLGFVEAILWCWAGIIAGDSIIYFLGRFVGSRVYLWPVLRSHFRPVKRKRFEQRYRDHGTKATFLARFFPGFRMIAFFVAGNLRFSYIKFLVLDSIGAALTVPISIYLGKKFSQNLDYVRDIMHEFQIPLTIVGIIGLSVVIYLVGRKRRIKLQNLLHLRKQRSEDDAQR
jgi:membrane protein DedA with SNARE-associated domain